MSRTSDASTTAAGLVPPGAWRVDPASSRVGFVIRKLGAGTVHGHFEELSGWLVADANDASAGGSVRVASIATGNADRDSHLLAPGFFAADEYPEITFEARSVAPVGANRWRIVGDLTIRDQTREVVLDASRPPASRRLQLSGQIDRRSFDLTWNRAIEATGAVGTTVGIELDLELTR